MRLERFLWGVIGILLKDYFNQTTYLNHFVTLFQSYLLLNGVISFMVCWVFCIIFVREKVAMLLHVCEKNINYTRRWHGVRMLFIDWISKTFPCYSLFNLTVLISIRINCLIFWKTMIKSVNILMKSKTFNFIRELLEPRLKLSSMLYENRAMHWTRHG